MCVFVWFLCEKLAIERLRKYSLLKYSSKCMLLENLASFQYRNCMEGCEKEVLRLRILIEFVKITFQKHFNFNLLLLANSTRKVYEEICIIVLILCVLHNQHPKYWNFSHSI